MVLCSLPLFLVHRCWALLWSIRDGSITPRWTSCMEFWFWFWTSTPNGFPAVSMLSSLSWMSAGPPVVMDTRHGDGILMWGQGWGRGHFGVGGLFSESSLLMSASTFHFRDREARCFASFSLVFCSGFSTFSAAFLTLSCSAASLFAWVLCSFNSRLQAAALPFSSLPPPCLAASELHLQPSSTPSPHT